MEWSPSHSASYYLTLAAGVTVSLLLARRFAKVRTGRSLLLLGLRAAVLAVLFLILLEPVRVTESRAPEQPPSAVYLVDCSRSMALEQPISRLDQARRTIASAEAQLAVGNRPTIELYGFGDLVQAFDQVGQLKAVANETDKVLYHPGEPILISARAFDERLEPTQAYRLVASLQGLEEQPGDVTSPQHSQTMGPRASYGMYQSELAIPRLSQWPASSTNDAGAVRKLVLRVVAYDQERVVTQSDLDVQIVDDSPEYRDFRPDRSSLDVLARESGGRALTDPRELADLLKSYRADPGEVTVRRTPIWATPAVCLALIVLLTTEWIVRRTKGLA